MGAILTCLFFVFFFFSPQRFNVLEMVGPGVTPEHGVTGYAGDPTQGPACAIACGAGTIYRNYFAPTNGQIGQTEDNQLDGIAEMRDMLCDKLGKPRGSLWRMRNGYCMPSRETLYLIAEYLEKADEATLDELRAKLSIGLHWDVEITDGREDRKNPLFLSQAYCSALPVSYCGHSRTGYWDDFATLVLESLYESTLLAGILHARQGGNNKVYLTQVGGGAFGNSRVWIEKAVRRALAKFRDWDLDVIMVCYGSTDSWIRNLIDEMHPPRPRMAMSMDDGSDGDVVEDEEEGSSSDFADYEKDTGATLSLTGSMPGLSSSGDNNNNNNNAFK